MTDGLRYWVRMAAMLVVTAAGVLAVFGRFEGPVSWQDLVVGFGTSFVFSACIGLPLAVVLPRIGPAVRERWPFPFDWLALIATMLVGAAAGSLVAIAGLTAVGLLEVSSFWPWFARSIRTSVLATLTFGIAVTLYETLRARLDATTLALRTKERDEADARRLAVEAQLASLESRVQPHFLFNTLNSIAALIPQDPAGAEKMTGQLASLLRASLDAAPTALVPLAEEIGTVRDYLEIERVRFGDRLRYTVDQPAELAAIRVPRLSLQTLVENAVKFAVAPRRTGGSIQVHAAADGGRLRLSVTDDGPGFDGENPPAGHGLTLMRDRLQMLFGERARLLVDGQAGRATVAIEIDHGVPPPVQAERSDAALIDPGLG